MRLPCRTTVSGAPAAAGAIGLTVTLAAVLLGGCAPARAPADSHQLLSPFTGEPAASSGPVLAVKIDNLAPARPQTGLTDADLIYVLPVEGGLSRILAVFSIIDTTGESALDGELAGLQDRVPEGWPRFAAPGPALSFGAVFAGKGTWVDARRPPPWPGQGQRAAGPAPRRASGSLKVPQLHTDSRCAVLGRALTSRGAFACAALAGAARSARP